MGNLQYPKYWNIPNYESYSNASGDDLQKQVTALLGELDGLNNQMAILRPRFSSAKANYESWLSAFANRCGRKVSGCNQEDQASMNNANTLMISLGREITNLTALIKEKQSQIESAQIELKKQSNLDPATKAEIERQNRMAEANLQMAAASQSERSRNIKIILAIGALAVVGGIIVLARR
jgi:hypothetical protein